MGLLLRLFLFFGPQTDSGDSSMKTILVILQELVQQYYHRLLYGAKKDDLKLSGIEIEELAEVRAEK